MPKMETKFTLADLSFIMRHFVKEYDFGEGTSILDHEYFIDVAKNTVVFKITVQRNDDDDTI